MTYDNLDRLLTAVSGTGGYGSWSWTYDANGNRTSETNPTGTNAYTLYSGTNRIHTVDDLNNTNFVYNNAGSTTKQYNGTYLNLTNAFDLSEQLYTPTYSGYGSPSAYNDYGEDHNMVTKSSNIYHLYAYNRTSNLLLHEEDANNDGTDYIYLDPDAPSGSNAWPVAIIATFPSGMSTATATFYMHGDRLGTPQYMTDSGKTVRWSMTYQPFGFYQTFSSTYNLYQHLAFPGAFEEDETDYFYIHNRHYDPQRGVFIQSDPIGLDAGTTNTYAYANQNPFRFTDPSGEATITVQYKLVPGWVNFGIKNSVGTDAYHAFLVVTDTDGTQTYFRGGPNFDLGLGFGSLGASYGLYQPGTPDWVSQPCASQKILSNNEPAKQYLDALEDYTNAINNSYVPYGLPLATSNTYVSTAITQALNLPLPPPPVFVPGWLPEMTRQH